MQHDRVLEILQEARSLISKEECWVTGCMCIEYSGYNRYCALGALQKAAGCLTEKLPGTYYPYAIAAHYLSKAMCPDETPPLIEGREGYILLSDQYVIPALITGFNDYGVTHEQVIQAFDKAIEARLSDIASPTPPVEAEPQPA